jgi:hypothetical protein
MNDAETQFLQEEQILGIIVIMKWNICMCLVGYLSIYKQILFDTG